MKRLDADIYDTLELSAYAHHGIGQPLMFDILAPCDPRGNRPPCCILGHSDHVDPVGTAVEGALSRLGITGSLSDAVVRRINTRKHAPPNARVSWAAWCAELGVIRG